MSWFWIYILSLFLAVACFSFGVLVGETRTNRDWIDFLNIRHREKAETRWEREDEGLDAALPLPKESKDEVGC